MNFRLSSIILLALALAAPVWAAPLGGEWVVEDDTAIKEAKPAASENPLNKFPRSPADKEAAGNSNGSISAVPGVNARDAAVKFSYTLGEKFEYRYAMLSLMFKKPCDFSGFKALRFWLKGSGNKMEVDICTDAVLDYDYHAYTIKTTPGEWKQVEIPFAVLRQAGWGAKVDFDPAWVNKIQFKASSTIIDEKGFFVLDGVELSTSSPFVGKISGNPFMLSDFEEGLVDRLGDEWKPEDDSPNGGNSRSSLNTGDGQGASKGSLRMEYTLGPAYKYRYAIAKVEFQNPIELSSYKSLSFWVKGNGKKLKIHLCSATVKDYDWHGSTFAATPQDWTEYVVPFASLTQEGWGRPRPLDLKKIQRIEFVSGSAESGEQGWFEVDNLTFRR
jgi:hypothetical protein